MVVFPVCEVVLGLPLLVEEAVTLPFFVFVVVVVVVWVVVVVVVGVVDTVLVMVTGPLLLSVIE